MTEQIFEVNEKNFEAEVLHAAKPVMVDFWATWCTQCKALDPVIAQLADAYSGSVRFGKCNLTENMPLAAKYGIRSVPFLLFFKNGNVEEQLYGTASKAQIEKSLKKLAG